MFLPGLHQIRQSCLESVVRSQNVDIHDGLEGIDRELLNGGEEVARSTSAMNKSVLVLGNRERGSYMTKSMEPSSLTQRSAASFKLSNLRTSTAPMPITLAPGRIAAISFAALSVFSTLRPMIQALAPRWTSARTWALQMVPAPPVQKTTLFAGPCVS